MDTIPNESSRTMTKHLRIMTGIIHDFKAAGKEISEGEQVLNLIHALLVESQHWNHVKTILTHSEHIKTFAEVQSHIEMEEERLKMLDTPYVDLVAKENRPKGNKNNRGRLAKKGFRPPRMVGPRLGSPRNRRSKAMEGSI